MPQTISRPKATKPKRGILPRRAFRRGVPILVAIAGGSGSGKSWLADKLQKILHPKAGRLCLDDFYRDRSHLPAARRSQINFDHPRAIDWPLLERVLKSLLARRPARAPSYDFKTHSRLPKLRTIRPTPIVLIEGLWVLRRPSIRRLLSLSVFLDSAATTRLNRRIARDLATRGRSVSSIRRQFLRCVQPMHRRFVSPQRLRADLVFKRNCGKAEIDRVMAVVAGVLQPARRAVERPPKHPI